MLRSVNIYHHPSNLIFCNIKGMVFEGWHRSGKRIYEVLIYPGTWKYTFNRQQAIAWLRKETS